MTTDNISFEHHSLLDIRTKLILMAWVVTFSFLFNDPFAHATLLGLLVCGTVCFKFRFFFLKALLPLLPIFLMIIIFVGFSPVEVFDRPENREILFSLSSGFGVSTGGIKLGITFICRLINLVFTTRILFTSGNMDEFISLTHKIRLPIGLAFSLSAAFRFIPELKRKRQMIITARKVRGEDFETRGMINSYLQQIRVMIPLIINAILMAENLAVSLLSRGFAFRNYRTELNPITIRLRDWLLILTAMLTLIAMVTIRIKSNWGNL